MSLDHRRLDPHDRWFATVVTERGKVADNTLMSMGRAVASLCCDVHEPHAVVVVDRDGVVVLSRVVGRSLPRWRRHTATARARWAVKLRTDTNAVQSALSLPLVAADTGVCWSIAPGGVVVRSGEVVGAVGVHAAPGLVQRIAAEIHQANSA